MREDFELEVGIKRPREERILPRVSLSTKRVTSDRSDGERPSSSSTSSNPALAE